MGFELIAVTAGLITIVGGGGMWLGILQNRVKNSEEDIEKLVSAMNGHLKEFNTVVTKVSNIELTCESILRKVDNLDPSLANRVKNLEDGPEG
jgi:hypothetical protein